VVGCCCVSLRAEVGAAEPLCCVLLTDELYRVLRGGVSVVDGLSAERGEVVCWLCVWFGVFLCCLSVRHLSSLIIH
jgi:hypothetical protein